MRPRDTLPVIVGVNALEVLSAEIYQATRRPDSESIARKNLTSRRWGESLPDLDRAEIVKRVRTEVVDFGADAPVLKNNVRVVSSRPGALTLQILKRV